MAKITAKQWEMEQELKRIEKHKKYLAQYGKEKLTDLLGRQLRDKKPLPQNMKLKEYVDFLVAEVEKESAQ